MSIWEVVLVTVLTVFAGSAIVIALLVWFAPSMRGGQLIDDDGPDEDTHL